MAVNFAFGSLAFILFFLISNGNCQDEIEGSYSDNEDLEDYPIFSGEDLYEILKLLRENETEIISSFAEYSNENLEYDQLMQKPLNTAIIVLYSIITVVGLIANAIVFFVIFGGNEIGKTVTAIYVLQLTIADTVFLFTLPIFSMQKVTKNWTFGTSLCKLCQTVKFMNYYAGIFFLMAMSVDRFVAVAYSTRLTKLRTKHRTYLVCICMWTIAILMSLPQMLYAVTEDVGLDVSYCRVLFPGYDQYQNDDASFEVYSNGDYVTGKTYDLSNDTDIGNEEGSEFLNQDTTLDAPLPAYCNHGNQSYQYKIWLVINFTFGFLIPFIVIVVSYVKILTHLKTSEEKIGHTATNRAVKTRKRVTKMVAALVCCFTICWLPHHLFVLAKIHGLDVGVTTCYATEEFLVALAFSNSAINPILYTFMGNNFKERLRKSVNNTTRKLRKNSRSLPSRQSFQSDGHRKLSAPVQYHRGSKTPDYNGQNGRKASKLSQIALLRRGSSMESRKGEKQIVKMRDDRETAGLYATTTVGDQTVETKI